MVDPGAQDQESVGVYTAMTGALDQDRPWLLVSMLTPVHLYCVATTLNFHLQL